LNNHGIGELQHIYQQLKTLHIAIAYIILCITTMVLTVYRPIAVLLRANHQYFEANGEHITQPQTQTHKSKQKERWTYANIDVGSIVSGIVALVGELFCSDRILQRITNVYA